MSVIETLKAMPSEKLAPPVKDARKLILAIAGLLLFSAGALGDASPVRVSSTAVLALKTLAQMSATQGFVVANTASPDSGALFEWVATTSEVPEAGRVIPPHDFSADCSHGCLIRTIGGVSSSPVRVFIASGTALVTDSVLYCDSTSADVRITTPVALGSSTVVKRFRVVKIAGSNRCTISLNGSADFAEIINTNDIGGAGWLDVELNGSTAHVFGVP